MNSRPRQRNYISLFSGGGIGDLGFRAAGLNLSYAVEISEERAALLSRNFPETEVFAEDVYIFLERVYKKSLATSEYELITITPPCQGMSSNGQGKMLSLERMGKRESEDGRNSLILPAIEIAKELKPKWVFIENVPKMRNQRIKFNGSNSLIIDIIETLLGGEYIYKFENVNFADYGIPQNRKRLIGIFCRKDVAELNSIGVDELFPDVTHNSCGKSKRKWLSLRDAIGGLPHLDGKDKKSSQSENIPLHRVPVLDAKKYEWIRHTPEGDSAFNNQCAYCNFGDNPRHSMKKNTEGINQASKETPLYCISCGMLLPRPYTLCKETGQKRIMSGYTSAYKRMSWDEPAPTLTMNLQYPSSDNKIHPDQNRVLSLLEAEIIQTIDKYNYYWNSDMNSIRPECQNTLIADVIGESIPPLFTEIVGTHILDIKCSAFTRKGTQPLLFS